MVDRVSSDHPSVDTLRGRIGRRGGTTRPRIELPPGAREHLPVDEVVRLVIDGSTRHGIARDAIEGDGLVVDGAYDSSRLARSPARGSDRLAAWLEAVDIGIDRTVLVDVVVAGFLYGIRRPGTRAVYDAYRPPSPDLARVAERVDDA